jgi:hypothetical protein
VQRTLRQQANCGRLCEAKWLTADGLGLHRWEMSAKIRKLMARGLIFAKQTWNKKEYYGIRKYGMKQRVFMASGQETSAFGSMKFGASE